MNRCFLSLAFGSLLIASAVSAQNVDPVPVIITAGQSNTDGRVFNDSLPDYIKCDGYKFCQWSYCNGTRDTIEGHFEPFFPRMSSPNKPGRWTYDAVVYYRLEQLWQKPFFVIKQSQGGTSIDPECKSTADFHWSANPDWLDANSSANHGGLSLLKAFTDNISLCIDSQLSKLPQGFDIKFMLWHQGESDAGRPDRYYDNLSAVVAYVRAFLVAKTGDAKYEHLPFICGSVPRASRRFKPQIDEAFRRLAAEDDNFYVVDLSEASLQSDMLHFTAKSAEDFGNEILKIVQKNLM